MKKNLIFTMCLLFITVFEILASPGHGHYRWRNDNGTEALASWRAEEDDSVVVSDEGNIRLRLEMWHSSGTDINLICYLYYASLNDTVWHVITDNASNAFVFADSPNLTNGDATTGQRLSKYNDGHTNQPGIIRDAPGAFLVTMSAGQRKEYEFCIKATPNTNFNQGFVFRIEDENVEEADFYYNISSLPKLFLRKPILTVTANNATRPQGQANPDFTVTYTGFVDGDDESELDNLPSVSCSANESSAPGQYDIVPYGGSDNKYDFLFVVGKLTVTDATGIEQVSDIKPVFFPNPVQDILYIKGQLPENQIIRITDLTGRMLIEQEPVNGAIDLHSLSKGIYLLHLNDNVYKIAKE
jgi:hypothetical protein